MRAHGTHTAGMHVCGSNASHTAGYTTDSSPFAFSGEDINDVLDPSAEPSAAGLLWLRPKNPPRADFSLCFLGAFASKTDETTRRRTVIQRA